MIVMTSRQEKPTCKATATASSSVASSLKVRMVSMVMRVLRVLLHNHHDGVNLNTQEAAWRQVWRQNDEKRELMLIEAVKHIKMARAQRALYQAMVELAV